jgi:hypothetical protein
LNPGRHEKHVNIIEVVIFHGMGLIKCMMPVVHFKCPPKTRKFSMEKEAVEEVGKC